MNREVVLDHPTTGHPATGHPTTAAPAPRFAPIVCVIDHLHRSRDVAEAAVAGRFSHAGVTLELGGSPDWVHGGLPGDEEWRIEWVKLYEGMDLAAAFQETGDPRYSDAWVQLVDSFIRQVEVGCDTSDVSARRIQNWLYAAQRFDSVPEIKYPPGFADRLTERLGLDLAHLRDHLTAERNHRTLELYALMLGAIAMRDSELATFALDELATNAATDIWSDGVHRECSSDYHMIVARSLLGAIVNATASGLACPEGLRSRAHAALRFGLHLQCPDGTTPALSDGDRGAFRELFGLAALVFDDPQFEWVAARGRSGVAPAERNVVFPVGGYVVQRSGWGSGPNDYADERHAVFDCGPIGDGGHGHYDQLSVEMYGRGQRLVVDPGRYTYADDDTGLRHWFKGSAAHNTVTVDGLDHVPYRKGKPKGPQSVATWLGSVEHDGVAMTRAELRSPRYAAVHARRIFFVDRDFWIVHDEVRDHTTHDYALRWHLDAAAEGRTAIEWGDPTVVHAPGCTIAIAGTADVRLEPGWVSEQYGTRRPAPIVVARAYANSADLVSVIVPGDLGDTVAVRITPTMDAIRVRCDLGGRAIDLGWERDVTNFMRLSERPTSANAVDARPTAMQERR